jgi:succinate dehydrogenase/fumarate reductase iron-sulfur protein
MERTMTATEARRIGQEETRDGPVARLERLREGDTVHATIFRFDPRQDREPRYETYDVPYSKWMRVLDVLNYVAEDLEVDLSYRWYCGAAMCGTCAVRVNGREILACWEPAEPEMTIEPLRNAPVVRDLVIDRMPYEDRVLRMMPWLTRKKAYGGFPEPLSHRDMAKASRALDCLSCMACFSACPVVGLGDETKFAGPAPFVQLAQTALDPRDGLDRGTIALEQGSIFDCVSCYKCEEVCPASIPIVTGVIEPLKALAFKSAPARSRHAGAFLHIVRSRGRIDPSALVVSVQGLAALRNLGRIVKLLLRGKIDPLKTVFGFRVEKIEEIRQIFTATKGER